MSVRATQIVVTVMCDCGEPEEFYFDEDEIKSTEILDRCSCGTEFGIYADGTVNIIEADR